MKNKNTTIEAHSYLGDSEPQRFRAFFLRGQGEVDVIDLATKSRQRSGLWERDEGMMNPE